MTFDRDMVEDWLKYLCEMVLGPVVNWSACASLYGFKCH